MILPRLYPIVDSNALQAKGLSQVVMTEALLEAGVKIVQFRHKESWTEDVFQQARQISFLVKEAGAMFVVNDRADFAALLGAGVHLGQEDLPPAAARRVVGQNAIGYSTHTAQQLRAGDAEDVQYLAIGPIYETNSKKHPDPAIGTDGLGLLRPLTRKPLVAIGGITQANARLVLAAGADSVAVIGGLLPAECDRATVRRRAEEWLRLLE